jgi:biotin carboxylase
VKLSSRGPVIIEVNGRLGGDLIPRLGMLATGIDPGQAAADVAVGVPPCLEASRRGCVAIRFLYPPQDCRVLEVCLPEPDAAPGLVAAHAIARPGDMLRLPPRAHIARFAYVICAADDPGSCADRLEAAAKLTTIRYQAVDSSELPDGRPW